MRSSTETLIKAMRILAVDIQSNDGIANAAISEAADRLEELQAKREPLSDEQIGLLSTTPTFSGMHPDYLRDCVRAIEAAHGIKP